MKQALVKLYTHCNVVLAAVAFSAHQKKMLIWLEKHFKGHKIFKCRVHLKKSIGFHFQMEENKSKYV